MWQQHTHTHTTTGPEALVPLDTVPTDNDGLNQHWACCLPFCTGQCHIDFSLDVLFTGMNPHGHFGPALGQTAFFFQMVTAFLVVALKFTLWKRKEEGGERVSGTVEDLAMDLSGNVEERGCPAVVVVVGRGLRSYLGLLPTVVFTNSEVPVGLKVGRGHGCPRGAGTKGVRKGVVGATPRV